MSLDAAAAESNVTCYRLGSVGQDTNLCLWDITEDMLRPSKAATGAGGGAAGGGGGPVNHSNNAISSPFEPHPSTVSAAATAGQAAGGHSDLLKSKVISNSNSVTSKDSGIVDNRKVT